MSSKRTQTLATPKKRLKRPTSTSGGGCDPVRTRYAEVAAKLGKAECLPRPSPPGVGYAAVLAEADTGMGHAALLKTPRQTLNTSRALYNTKRLSYGLA